jgi:hypothetical protein
MRAACFRMVLAVLAAVTAFSSSATASGSVVPDFSGTWKLDPEKSAQLARERKGGSVALIFGEDCVITQTADLLILNIAAGALKVEATYRLDGRPSGNVSPGARGGADIPITSTTRWIGDTLEITTRSESELDGVTVPVESTRKVWLTADGLLAVERRGSPARIVPDAWNVYRKLRAASGALTR